MTEWIKTNITAILLVAIALVTLSYNSCATRQEMNAQFNTVNAQFNTVNARFDAVDARFDAIERRLDRMEARSSRIEDKVEALNQNYIQHLAQHNKKE